MLWKRSVGKFGFVMKVLSWEVGLNGLDILHWYFWNCV